MSVYVDQSRNPYGQMIMCHMIADTPSELKSLALEIGLQLRWFQQEASMPHFDIALSKKKLAIQHGAIELNRNEFVAKMKQIKLTWPIRQNGDWIL